MLGLLASCEVQVQAHILSTVSLNWCHWWDCSGLRSKSFISVNKEREEYFEAALEKEIQNILGIPILSSGKKTWDGVLQFSFKELK